jgi:hypothetical protein
MIDVPPQLKSFCRGALLCLLLLSGASEVWAQLKFPEEENRARPKVQPVTKPDAAFVLLDGTPVKLKLMRDLSSAVEQVGTTVDFEVLEDVALHEKVVIRQGALALGTVTEAVPKRRMGRTGKLEVQLTSVVLTDGTRVPLRSVSTAVDGSRVGTVSVAAAAVSMVFLPAAPLVLLIKGKDLTIPKDTFVTGYVNGDLPLDAEKFKESSLKNTTPINFKVNVEGAEIWIDAKFVGHAPATLRLPEGEFEVFIRKPGYQTWRRVMAVPAGSLMNLTISLEKLP